jgi:2,3-bisphosphoglycerate-independent phosphoglycerate mutase
VLFSQHKDKEEKVYDRLLGRLVKKNSSKILLMIMDGLGGLPFYPGGSTELEEADIPEIDRLAKESALGLHDPVMPGITPGSGPAHLGVFGYDPVKWQIGRGVLAALGIGFALAPDDLAARANFATMDSAGNISDRRAGRISTETNRELCGLLDGMKIGGAQVIVKTVKEHRAAVIFRGGKFSGSLADSDPQVTGVPPKKVVALDAAAGASADLANAFIAEADKRLADRHPANTILLRGFAMLPEIPSFDVRYGLKACAIATYPMYKGLARLVGMDVLESGETLDSQIEVLKKAWDKHDFFFFHYKYTDSRGEDGDFGAKVKAIEDFDRHLPEIARLEPDVLILTGDHSTPSALKSHSWHPVPLMLRSKYVIPDLMTFSERNCSRGSLGRMRALEIMPLAMANALRLEKYGA